jgi:hypothetical protein
LFWLIAFIIADLFLSDNNIANMQFITLLWLLWIAPDAPLNK